MIYENETYESLEADCIIPEKERDIPAFTAENIIGRFNRIKEKLMDRTGRTDVEEEAWSKLQQELIEQTESRKGGEQ